MNTALIKTASGVIHAAQQQGRTLPVTLAIALDAACLLQSPETATQIRRDTITEVAEKADERCLSYGVFGVGDFIRRLSDQPAEMETLRNRVAELEQQREALGARLQAGQTWEDGRLVSEDYVSQRELRALFGIKLTAPATDGGEPGA